MCVFVGSVFFFSGDQTRLHDLLIKEKWKENSMRTLSFFLLLLRCVWHAVFLMACECRRTFVSCFFFFPSSSPHLLIAAFFFFFMSFIGLFVPLHPCVSRVVINSSLDKRSNYTFIFVDVVAFFFSATFSHVGLKPTILFFFFFFQVILFLFSLTCSSMVKCSFGFLITPVI